MQQIVGGRDPHLTILDYRNTPTQDADASPTQRNLGKRTSTLLPMKATLLIPRRVDVEFAKKRQKRKNMRSTWYHNKGAKDLNPLEEGDYVRIKPTILGEKG